MTLQETLRLAGSMGDFPEVEIETPVRHSSLTAGRIVEINTKGVAVFFPDMKWNTWFYWENGSDKRSHYASELKLQIRASVFNGLAEPKKLNNSELVSEIEWLLRNYPGSDHETLLDYSSEYGFRLRNIYHANDGNAALIVARCLGPGGDKSFTKGKLQGYWNSTAGLTDEERLYNFRTVEWYDNGSSVSKND